jgi:hypothetical protein
MAKTARKASVPRVTLEQFERMRRDVRRQLVAIRAIVAANADVLQLLRRDCEASFRRCAELQAEIDALKKGLVHSNTGAYHRRAGERWT